MNRSFHSISLLATLGIGTALLLAGLPAQAADGKATRASAKTTAEQVARGKYLVNTSGCHDCHTPFKMGPNGPEPDMSRMLSGHPSRWSCRRRRSCRRGRG